MKRRIKPEIREWLEAVQAVCLLFLAGAGFGMGAAFALMILDWMMR